MRAQAHAKLVDLLDDGQLRDAAAAKSIADRFTQQPATGVVLNAMNRALSTANPGRARQRRGEAPAAVVRQLAAQPPAAAAAARRAHALVVGVHAALRRGRLVLDGGARGDAADGGGRRLQAAQDNASLLTILAEHPPGRVDQPLRASRSVPARRRGRRRRRRARARRGGALLRRCASPCAAPTAPSSPSAR